MLPIPWDEIAGLVESSRALVPATTERLDRGEAEVFTPTSLVVEILREVDINVLGPGRRVVDPACGDGQFLVAAKAVKTLYFGMSEQLALQDIYGVDVVRENVDACRARLQGGTICMGDSLNALRRLEGQTQEEWVAVQALFPLPMNKRNKASRDWGKPLEHRGEESIQPSLFA
jgi:hypothetical protein